MQLLAGAVPRAHRTTMTTETHCSNKATRQAVGPLKSSLPPPAIRMTRGKTIELNLKAGDDWGKLGVKSTGCGEKTTEINGGNIGLI